MTEDLPTTELDPIGDPPWLEDLRDELELQTERAIAPVAERRTLLDRLFSRN